MIENNIKKIKANYFIYSFLLIIYTISLTFSSSYIDEIIPTSMSTVQIFTWIGLILIYFLRDKISIKKMFFSISLVIILILINFNVTDRTLITSFLFIICYPEKLDFNKLSFKLLITLTIVTLLIILLSFCGLITNVTFYRKDNLRQSLGFVSANACANFVTLIIILYATLRKENWIVMDSVISFVILYIINQFTNSRLAFGIGLLTILLMNLKNILKKNQNIIYFLAKYLYLFLSIFCILVTIYFNDKSNTNLFVNINEILTGRLGWIEQYYNQYGLKLFGQNIVTVGKKNSLESNIKWSGIDNVYMYTCIKYGLIYFIVFSILYVKLGSYLKEKNFLYEAIFVILICLIGITENLPLYPSYNIALLIIGKMYASNKIVKEGEIDV